MEWTGRLRRTTARLEHEIIEEVGLPGLTLRLPRRAFVQPKRFEHFPVYVGVAAKITRRRRSLPSYQVPKPAPIVRRRNTGPSAAQASGLHPNTKLSRVKFDNTGNLNLLNGLLGAKKKTIVKASNENSRNKNAVNDGVVAVKNVPAKSGAFEAGRQVHWAETPLELIPNVGFLEICFFTFETVS